MGAVWFSRDEKPDFATSGAHFGKFGFGNFVREFFLRCETLGIESQLLLPLVQRVRGVHEFFEEKTDRRRIPCLYDLLSPEKDRADRVRHALDGQLFVDRFHDRREAVVNADDFLAFDHDRATISGSNAERKRTILSAR